MKNSEYEFKVIIVAGATRNVGKTTLLRQLAELFPSSFLVKLGKPGEAKKDKRETLLGPDVSIEYVFSLAPKGTSIILLESSRLLLRYTSDLSIFIDANSGDRKPYADEVKARADLVVGEALSKNKSEKLKERLLVDSDCWGDILNLTKVSVC
jgi:hypothetical protein